MYSGCTHTDLLKCHYADIICHMKLARGQEAEDGIEVPGLPIEVVLIGLKVGTVAQLKCLLLTATSGELAQPCLRPST